ncbi:MAG TPA: L,D-transpeptidase family protein, partial [Vicinamibacteria bacterium]
MRWAWIAGAALALWAAWPRGAASAPRSVADVVRTLGPAARARLEPHFAHAAVAYPPAHVTFIILKEERRLELWAGPAPTGQRRVRSYEILAASGRAGPKLRQGDLQVPEGSYRVLWLNPNSAYHLSLKLDYPNAFDRAQARADRRVELGGDIFIHGRAVSIGCVAIGDPGIEELFVLAAEVTPARVRTLVAPHDFRRRAPPSAVDPPWVAGLYRDLAHDLRA